LDKPFSKRAGYEKKDNEEKQAKIPIPFTDVERKKKELENSTIGGF